MGLRAGVVPLPVTGLSKFGRMRVTLHLVFTSSPTEHLGAVTNTSTQAKAEPTPDQRGQGSCPAWTKAPNVVALPSSAGKKWPRLLGEDAGMSQTHVLSLGT